MTIIETPRLLLRCFTDQDAPFVYALLNDPDWVRFIGNKDVHDLGAARHYIRNGPLRMYAQYGFGLWLVERRSDRTPAGMCGLIRREGVADVDIGFAFLPAFRGLGYAREAAAATLDYAWSALGLPRIVAFTTPDNTRSGRLLEAIGLVGAGDATLPESTEVLRMYAVERGA